MPKKVYIVIFLLIVLIVATVAIIYATQFASVTQVVPGVHAGETFTYTLQGVSNLIGLDAVEPAGFSQYNGTDYYKVTITDVNGSIVSLDTLWRFTNETIVTGAQTIDLANGMETNRYGFWAIYVSNLNVNNLLRPKGYDGLIVNSTSTRAYADSNRQTNFWSIDNEFFDTSDPTSSTWRYDSTGVNFDKETGMLVNLVNIQQYNNPQMTLVITWKLVSSSVWNVQ
jgi:hypothetical protein